MKRNILNKLAIISCLLVMVSCAAKKQLVKSVVAAPVETVKPVNKMAGIASHQLNFTTFSGKASTRLNVDGNSNDVTLNIRIDHDKQIWVSITATVLITVEVARAVITPDSIKVINKLQGVYLKKPFSYIYSYSNKQLNYKMLEAILVGNALPEILKDNRADFATDSQVSGNIQDLLYKIMLSPDMKVTQLNLDNQSQGQTLQVNNGNFMPAGDGVVPSQIDIHSTTAKNKIQANLHYTKVDLNQQLQYPFNIPESYKPADGN